MQSQSSLRTSRSPAQAVASAPSNPAQPAASALSNQTQRSLLFSMYTALDTLVGNAGDQSSAEQELRAAFAKWPMLLHRVNVVSKAGEQDLANSGGADLGTGEDGGAGDMGLQFSFGTSDLALCGCPHAAHAIGMLDPVDALPELEGFFTRRQA